MAGAIRPFTAIDNSRYQALQATSSKTNLALQQLKRQ